MFILNNFTFGKALFLIQNSHVVSSNTIFKRGIKILNFVHPIIEIKAHIAGMHSYQTNLSDIFKQ